MRKHHILCTDAHEDIRSDPLLRQGMECHAVDFNRHKPFDRFAHPSLKRRFDPDNARHLRILRPIEDRLRRPDLKNLSIANDRHLIS